jgi:hypothetical protein
MQTIIFTALITAGICFAIVVTFGQMLSEWWQRKKARDKYLRQQTAIMESYRALVLNGIDTMDVGVGSTNTLNEEELIVREQFIKDMKFIRPALKNCPDFLVGRTLAAALTKQLMEKVKAFIMDDYFSENDRQWFAAYMTALLGGLRDDLEELDFLTSDGIVSMKDSARYEKIRARAFNIRLTYEMGMSFLAQLDKAILEMQENANEQYVKKHM